jgi:tetratricopeptide (TPR) repeat protein
VGISYLALLVFVFTIGMRGLRNGDLEDKKLLLGLISAWLAFQAQSLISIDNIGISIWGWFLAGGILGISYKRKQSDKTLNKGKVIGTQSNKVKVNLLQPLLSIIFLIPILLFTSILYRSETDLNLIKNYASIKNKQFVVDRANKILNNHLVDPNYRYITALYLSDVGENEEAYRIISEIHAFDSRNPEYLKGLASFEAFRNDPKKEILVRNEITKIDPWNAENYLQLLALYKKIGDVRMMNSTLDIILSFAPNSEQALRAKSLVEQIE